MNQIFKKFNINDYGILPFEKIKNNLIDCNNKKFIPKDTKSVIISVFPYYSKSLKRGNLSKYASVKDYHKVITEINDSLISAFKEVFPKEEFVPFCDNSPIKEVNAAVLCGLGVIGKNQLFISKKYGSYCFLSAIVTTLEIENYKTYDIKNCIGCNLCEKACPGNALANGKIDIKRCLSDINQRKGELSDFEKDIILKTGYVWGCDICQDVCPMNKNILETHIKEFKEDINENLFLKDIENLSNKQFKEKYNDRAFTFKGVNILKRNLMLFENKDI